MGRETTFAVPLDIPTTPRTKAYFRNYLMQLREQLDTDVPFGDSGQSVGIGFVWETKTALSVGGLNTLSRRMQRALKSSGLVSWRAEPYFLKQKIEYTRNGDPNVIFTLQED